MHDLIASPDTPRFLLLGVVFAPLAAAAAAAALGPRSRGFARWFALAHLALTALLAGRVAPELVLRGESSGAGYQADVTFRPVAVPGDGGVFGSGGLSAHATTWGLFTLAPTPPGVPPADVQFFIGVDGLNLWLVALTSLMTLVAVLAADGPAADRPGGFYGWLFALQAALTGAFAAFDVVLFYVFFELTLIPAFFLIGSWGAGGGRQAAARKFFLYTLFGSLLTLTGVIGVVLANPTPLDAIGADPRPAVGLTPTPSGDFLPPKAGPVTFSIPRLVANVHVWTLAKGNRQVLAGRTVDRLTREAADAQARAAGKADPGSARDAARARDALARAERDAAEAAADRAAYERTQVWLFVLLMAGFAVKIPVVPFHTWLPAAYAEAPAPVTAFLAAALSKLGTFGVIRLVLPLVPDAALAYGLPVFGGLGAAGVVYGAFCAVAQRDAKLLVAYSSVSHLGFLVIGLFAFDTEGLAGATLHMVNHGLATGALFALLGFLADRYRTTDMNQYGGLWARFPGYTALVFVVALASVGLPGLNNFVSEMLMLAGVFAPPNPSAVGYGIAVAAAVGIFLSAWYTLTMLRRVFFGPLHEPPTATGAPAPGLTRREGVAFGVPAALCVLLGVCPQPLIETMRADVGVVAGAGENARGRAGLLAPADRSAVRRPAPRPGGPGPDNAPRGGMGAIPPVDAAH